MTLKQISVFSENAPGRLGRITEILKKAKVGIKAVSVAEMGDFSIVRFIVDLSEKAEKVLEKENFSVGFSDILAIDLGAEGETLSKVAKIFGKSGININYVYLSLTKDKNPALIAKVSDINKANRVLKKAGIGQVDLRDLYSL